MFLRILNLRPRLPTPTTPDRCKGNPLIGWVGETACFLLSRFGAEGYEFGDGGACACAGAAGGDF